jgi:hypothetical protein
LADEDILVYCLDEISKDSQITLKELVQKLKDEKNIETSKSALKRALDAMDVTWKTIVKIPVNWNTPEILVARANFVTDMTVKFINRPKVFIDESGFNLHTKKKNGRALAGEPATISVVPRKRNLTLIMAINAEGIPHYQLIHAWEKKRGTAASDFRSFIIDLCAKVSFFIEFNL